MNLFGKYLSIPIFRVSVLFIAVLLVTLHILATPSLSAQANLSWSAPTTYTDGTPITNLAGHKIHIGTAPGSYSQNVDVGNITSYTLSSLNDATPYYFAVTAYDTTGVESGFSNQVSYTTPAPPPAASLYTLSAAAGSGGSITPSGSVVVSQGTSQNFTITPSTGYNIAGVTVDGTSVGAVSSYTFSNVTANHTIAATFAPNTTTSFTITATAGSNGTITPSGSRSVTSGASQSYTITPNTGYYVVSVVVDGATVVSNIPEGGYTHTFSNVTANHTISATFAIRYYQIVATAGSGGSISPTDVWSQYNTSQTVTMTPNSGYSVADVQVDGKSVGAISSYTFSGIVTNHTIAVNFAPNTAASFTITATAGSNGTITPSGSKSVISGASQSYTITPNTGYYVVSVLVDGTSVGAVSSYTFSGITANHTISATFAVKTYTISASAGTGGTISPSGTVSVTEGSSQLYAIKPNRQYTVSNVIVDGVSIGAVTSFTFSNVMANHTIQAQFTRK